MNTIILCEMCKIYFLKQENGRISGKKFCSIQLKVKRFFNVCKYKNIQLKNLKNVYPPSLKEKNIFLTLLPLFELRNFSSRHITIINNVKLPLKQFPLSALVTSNELSSFPPNVFHHSFLHFATVAAFVRWFVHTPENQKK